MNEKDRSAHGLARLGPARQGGRVRVRRIDVEWADARTHLDRLTLDANVLAPVLQQATERSNRLVGDRAHTGGVRSLLNEASNRACVTQAAISRPPAALIRAPPK